MKKYNFRNEKIPSGIKMFDKNNNELHNLNEYGRCSIIEIYDTSIAMDLHLSYKADTKNLRVYSGGGFFMPNIPENSGRYKLEFYNNRYLIWKYQS